MTNQDYNNSVSPFAPARITAAFLKSGIMGKQGSGKSKTAAKIAIGLVQHLKKMGVAYANKPVAFFDTEGGSDFLIPDFEKAGIPLDVAKKSGFSDLLASVRWAEKHNSVLIIDSITHPYRELIASYLRKKQRTFLQIDDWNYIKGDYGWAQFTKLFINSDLHIIMCGRAGDDLEQYTDENGKRQLEKIGVKMKTEAETGFEPSLLILMERFTSGRDNKTVHTATVLKDRWDLIDGKQFDNPGFENFLPHIQRLNLGGDHVGINETDSSPTLKVEKRDWQPVQRDIVLDEIKTVLELHAGGASNDAKKERLKLLLKHFDATWTEMEKVMPLDRLREGYDGLYRELTSEPSKYASLFSSKNTTTDIDDEIPDFDKPKPGLSIEDQLLTEIAKLNSMGDCLHFGSQLSTMHDIDAACLNRVNNALLQRQNEIGKNTKPDDDDDDGGPEPAKPGDGDQAPVPPPQQQPESPRPAARGKPTSKPKPAPVDAERTMADLVYAG